MTPPLICPRPNPSTPDPDAADCPLYDHRLAFRSEALHALILTSRQRPSLVALIAAEATPAAQSSRQVPAQLPAPIPSPTFPTPKVTPERK